MINWNEPIFALSKKGKLKVSIDLSYHRKENYVPIKFPHNVWTQDGSGGTWYADNNGQIIAGIGPTKYECPYTIVN